MVTGSGDTEKPACGGNKELDLREGWRSVHVCVYMHVCVRACVFAWLCLCSMHVRSYACVCVHVCPCVCSYVSQCGCCENSRKR